MACRKPSLKTLLGSTVIAGCFLVLLPVGVPYYYGNLSTYTDSYFRYCIGEDAFNVDPDWLLSTSIIFQTLGFAMVDVMAWLLPIHWLQLTTIGIFVLSVSLTFFSVHQTVGAMMLSLNIVSPFNSGLAVMICLKYAEQVMPERVGLVSAITTSSVSIGSFINNNIITSYINPDNVIPDIRLANTMYFSQARVLDNVPGVFIALGIAALILMFVGYLLQQIPLYFIKRERNKEPEINEHTRITSSMDKSNSSTTTFATGSEDTTHDGSNVNGIRNSDTPAECPPSLKPLEIFRTKSFYQLCLCRSVLTYCNIFALNYYKSFGLLWFEDDNFLASIGSFFAVSNAVIRLISGACVDAFGVKNTLAAVMSINAVLLAFWPIVPLLGGWIYFFYCQLLVGIQTSMYVTFPIAALKLYGSKFYATNYGLVLVPSVITSLVSPVLFVCIRDNFGYFPLVVLGSGGSLLALVCLLAMMPAD